MMNYYPRNIEKYLNKFGFKNYPLYPEINKKYEYIIVVPAVKESENIPKLLKSLAGQESSHKDKTLLIITVNNTKSAEDDIKSDNLNTLKYLRNAIDNDTIGGLNIAYVDASSEGFEMNDNDGGVGVARKTGMDTALRYFDYSPGKKQILGCLDADCTVEKNYYEAVYDYYINNNIDAGHVNYLHPLPDDEENKKAIICYEIFLRFYVLGLTYANSPYAFHTIGSTMNCTADAYVKIGGMNKRKAAEDFYFMEKLSKVTDIHPIEETTIYPSGRGSFRVPFGTGQRVNRYLAGTHEEYYIYNFSSFDILNKWCEFFYNSDVTEPDEIMKIAEEISPSLCEFLKQNDFEKDWGKILQNSKDSKQIYQQKKFWFDGFKTLKLIHFLRDNGYPNLPMFPHLSEVFKVMGIENPAGYKGEIIPPVDIQIEFLEILRKII